MLSSTADKIIWLYTELTWYKDMGSNPDSNLNAKALTAQRTEQL